MANSGPMAPGIATIDNKQKQIKIGSILFAFVILFGFLSIPFQHGLKPAGHSLLAVLLFMVVLWVTEAVSYSASSIILIAATAVVVGFTPDGHGHIVGTTAALNMALSGFATGIWVLVACALIIATALGKTGLAQRIGLSVLYVLGTNTRRVYLGLSVMCYIFVLVVPAQAAVAVVMTAICMGIIAEYNIKNNQNFAKGMLLIVAQGSGIAGLGILTSGAPPLQADRFIGLATHHTISWIDWLVYGLPFSIAMFVVLYFLIVWMFPPEMDELEGGRQLLRSKLRDMGPMPAKEKRLLIIMVATIILWATSSIQPIDNSTVAVLAAAAILFPGIGVVSWDEIVKSVNWGTIMLFGAAISLGTYLLKTGAAAWVAKSTIGQLGFEHLPMWLVLILVAFAFGIFSLGFSARTAAVAALVPTVLGFAQNLHVANMNVWGFTLILYYAIQFTAVVPVNDPMAIIAFGSNTFTVKDMLKLSIPLVIISMLLIGLFAMTYWHWLGVI
ncbi:anion permease [Fodinisporobacter ferrooxydans]|uniref:Sodium-dependent dicarboxylate transporter SdcS n=1 Tax=Fodinisporobacter ferrooxydans TaxID=2901836 RepID=A0ABY4CEP9_9BACL|nr:anion permease [Alicyclobacillaceae bacterium MYW30-H2]